MVRPLPSAEPGARGTRRRPATGRSCSRRSTPTRTPTSRRRSRSGGISPPSRPFKGRAGGRRVPWAAQPRPGVRAVSSTSSYRPRADVLVEAGRRGRPAARPSSSSLVRPGRVGGPGAAAALTAASEIRLSSSWSRFTAASRPTVSRLACAWKRTLSSPRPSPRSIEARSSKRSISCSARSRAQTATARTSGE